ncbi:heme-binding protein 2 [Takifugu flavidus]|uniref:Heme-binding protein 1 n=1 Tax=Takifugu flavidus TaxID=433684 RepID=A0A5C6NUA7_9TELE|nr:heme-binding protein 2 [Takifugu flavidus]TWW70121.1 Heme-binding protein 2 [Takifugu flavidus]
MLLLVLVGVLLVITAEARIGSSSELDFNVDTEQTLLFDVICKTDKYEVRSYDSEKWVSTEASSFSMEFASITAFRRLFKYIAGANEEGKKVEMTAPVLMEMEDVDRPFWETVVYPMSFLLPAEHQENPPKPTDSNVKLRTFPKMNVYVLSYGGWMTSLNEKSKAKALSKALDDAGAKYIKGKHYAAGYNSPMTLFNRHNEVWYVVEGDPVCASSGSSSSEETDATPVS